MDLFTLGLKLKSEGFAEAKRALTGIDAQGRTVAARFSGMQKALTGVAAAAAAVAVGRFLKSAIEEATEAERVLSELRGAVNNVGGNFELLRPSVDAAAASVQKLTRFSDEAARGALTRMVLISNDTKGSLKNLGLAADIAAGKHISLEQAAEIVGKTMAGNTRGLREFGIMTKNSDEALDQLRTKFKGFAEQDGKTFQGRLEMIRNAWNEVLESTGKAITGAGDAATSMLLLRDALMDLSTWIDKNAASWQSWVGGAVSTIASVVGWLNRIAEAANRAGLALHSVLSFGMGRNTGAFRDVTGGGSSGRADNIAAMVVSGGRPAGAGGGGTGSGRVRPASVNGTMPEIGMAGSTGGGFGGPLTGPGGVAQLPELFNETSIYAREAMERLQSEMLTVLDGVSNTLGDAVYNAFSAAFNGEGLGGIFETFGKTILAGLGNIIVQQGQALLSYGIAMQAAALGLTNPFTAGPAAIAAGAALIALGSAFGAIAKGGGGRGTAQAGAFRERSAASDIVTLKFVDRPGSSRNLVPAVPLYVTVIGLNDPVAIRAISTMYEKHQRRQA